MRTAEQLIDIEHAHRLSENLLSHLAKGREWATPGVQAAVKKAVAGLDTGIESASPRLQALLCWLAGELAAGVGTLTPRVQERIRRTGSAAGATVPVPASRRSSRIVWWAGGLLLIVVAGAAVWRSRKASREIPEPSATGQESGSASSDADADLTAGQR